MIGMCERHSRLMLYGSECSECKKNREERELQRKSERKDIGAMIIFIAVVLVALKSYLELIAR